MAISSIGGGSLSSGIQEITKYPKTAAILIKSGLTIQELLNELSTGNEHYLDWVEKLHSERFAKLCELKGANKVFLKLEDSRKYLYFISKAEEIEALCRIGNCTFEMLSNLEYDNLVNLNNYTLKDIAPRFYSIADTMKIEIEKTKPDLIRRLMTQIAFDKYCYALYSPQDVAVDRNLFGGFSGQHLYVLTPLIGNIIADNNPKYNEAQKKALKKLQQLWIGARDDYLLRHINYNRKPENYLPARLNKIIVEVALQFFILKIKHIENVENQNLLFFGGWKGHELMYAIRRDEMTKTYTFYIWNTGEGLDRHHYRIANIEMKGRYLYQTRATWSGLSQEQVTDSSFLKKIYMAKFAEYNNGGNVYAMVEQQFQKKQDPYSRNALDYHYPQERNDCSFKCFWAASADYLGRGGDRKFSFQVKADLISELQKLFTTVIPEQNRTQNDATLMMHSKYRISSLNACKINQDQDGEFKKWLTNALVNSYNLVWEPNAVQADFFTWPAFVNRA